MTRTLRAVVGLGVLAPVVGGCLAGTSPLAPIAASPAARTPASSATSVSLTVLAAASLKTAMDDVKRGYEASHPGLSLTFTFDASSTLRTQIEQGAPADVFLSADTTSPQKLVSAGLATAPTAFAGNLLTVIVPGANPAGIAFPADLARPGLRVVAAGDAVPITKYATQAIAKLATQPGYPADFAARVAANVVSKEEDVRAVVAKVELGEGDAAIVYATDALASTAVRAIAIPPAANVPATYEGVVVGASKQPGAAGAFLAWLAGPGGQATLRTYGFMPPPSP